MNPSVPRSTTFNNLLKPYSNNKPVAVLTPDHTQRSVVPNSGIKNAIFVTTENAQFYLLLITRLIDNYTAKLDQELRKHSETILRQEKNDR